jgi:hypothetical protein
MPSFDSAQDDIPLNSSFESTQDNMVQDDIPFEPVQADMAQGDIYLNSA